jgi:sugar phosphate isomerase/epimerase
MKNLNRQTEGCSRRQFIGKSLTLTAGLTVGAKSLFGAPAILKNLGKPNSLINGVQIGAITYSFRSMPDQSAEATLKYVVDCGISAIELMGEPAESFAGAPTNPVDMRAFFGLMRKSRDGGELTEDEKKEMDDLRAQMDSFNKELSTWRTSVSMDKFTQLKKMYADAGVSIYAFKPSTFGPRNTEAEMNYGMNAAKAIGANQVTMEFPGNDEQTKKLGDLGAKHKIYAAYHGHEQQTPTMWDNALNQSKYNAMNLDIGHYVATGNPPLDIINAKHDRIASMHIKDRQTPANGKGNLPWGTGDTPLTQILQLMRDKKYKFPATAELEYEIPADSDAVKELTKCIEYCRKALA